MSEEWLEIVRFDNGKINGVVEFREYFEESNGGDLSRLELCW